MIRDSAILAYPETAGHVQLAQRIFSGMAMNARVIPLQQQPAPSLPRGAQCPSCFTYNLVGCLPENRKIQKGDDLELKCALCGDMYQLQRQAA